MDPKSKRFKLLLSAIPAAFVLLALILLLSTRAHHIFTIYADGDYISQTLLDQFQKDTGIRVRLVTGDRTPDSNLSAYLAEQSDTSAAVEEMLGDASQAPGEAVSLTLPEQLRAPRDAAVESALKKAGKSADSSDFDLNSVKYPASEYDVVLTDGATLGTLREQGLIQPLTYAKVTNLKNISPEYRKLSYDPDGSYTITTMWEYVGLLVNTNLVSEQITSWDSLWDSRYRGQVVMPGQMHDALAVTLLAMGENPASDDPVRLNAALDKLEQQRPLVASYSGRDAYLLLQGNQAALFPCWSGDALAMMRENPALVFLLPPGGTYRTTFGYAIPTDSHHTEDALKFINYMCETEHLAKNAVYSKYASTSVAAIGKLDESWSDNPVIYPDVSVLASTPLLNPLPLSVADHCALRWRAILETPVKDPADSSADAASSSAGAEASGSTTVADSSGESGTEASKQAVSAEKSEGKDAKAASAEKSKEKDAKADAKAAAADKSDKKGAKTAAADKSDRKDAKAASADQSAK